MAFNDLSRRLLKLAMQQSDNYGTDTPEARARYASILGRLESAPSDDEQAMAWSLALLLPDASSIAPDDLRL